MGWATDILTGLALRLDTAGIGSYEPTAVYDPAASLPALTLQQLPDQPVAAIALSYFSAGGTGGVTAAVELQIRGGTDPTSPDDISDAIWTLLDQAADLMLGGVHVAVMWRQTSAPLGLDTYGRWTRADTYFLIADRPSTNWPD